jgi:hypothetical protein
MTKWPILNKLTGIYMVEQIRNGTNQFVGQHVEHQHNTFDENNVRGFVDRQVSIR